MSNSYKKNVRLKSSKQFQHVLEKTSPIRGRYISLHAYVNPTHPFTKFGVVASKKFGKAVIRNRFKRISREAFRRARSTFPTGTQLVVRPRKYAKDAKMFHILDELIELTQNLKG